MGVKHFGEGVPSVLSTPMLIALMEQTCVELLKPYLGEGEQTVGFHVDVKHTAPTKIGQKVTVKATLQEVKEQRFRLAVEAINDQGVKIGEGTHRRALINIKQFTSVQ
jgi:predicted thioesterase